MGFTLWNLLKASLLVSNSVAVLHRKRFLRKYGLDVADPNEPTSLKTQTVGLLNAVQYLKGPLIIANIIVVVVEFIFGGTVVFWHSMFPFFGRAANKDTFKPLKQHKSGKRVSLHQYSQATLATGVTRQAVACPPTEDPNEWLAVHTVDAYNEVSLLYGVIKDSCVSTKESCRCMNAGPDFEYLWADGVTHKKPTRVSAHQYVDLLMSWVDEQLNDEAVFPSTTEAQFPKNFKQLVSKIFTRLFRVYGHIYLNHVGDVERAGAISHLNSCFKHFIFFALEFGLIEERELVPLQVLVRTIVAEDSRK